MTEPFGDAAFEAFLDDISVPFSRQDVTLWRRRMILPFTLVTATGPIVLEDEAGVARNFELYLAACRAMQLTHVVRVPVGFEICHDALVIATYRTELLHHATRIVEPYTSSALLHPTEDGWKMSSIMNALGHHHWTSPTKTPKGDTR